MTIIPTQRVVYIVYYSILVLHVCLTCFTSEEKKRYLLPSVNNLKTILIWKSKKFINLWGNVLKNGVYTDYFKFLKNYSDPCFLRKCALDKTVFLWKGHCETLTTYLNTYTFFDILYFLIKCIHYHKFIISGKEIFFIRK